MIQKLENILMLHQRSCLWKLAALALTKALCLSLSSLFKFLKAIQLYISSFLRPFNYCPTKANQSFMGMLLFPNILICFSARDCWSVAFGHSHSGSDRLVASGYDNGDLKMFDLRSMALHWETQLPNGICSLAFDRKDIEKNKLLATCLEGRYSYC